MDKSYDLLIIIMMPWDPGSNPASDLNIYLFISETISNLGDHLQRRMDHQRIRVKTRRLKNETITKAIEKRNNETIEK